MRILIAARHSPTGLKPIGGVQSWSKTVGCALLSRGFEVSFWEPGSPLLGMFDLGIIANCGETSGVLRLCKKHVAISHGIIAPEKPPARNAVFTSEEVRDHWNGDGPIIRQPIDLNFWSPAKDARRYFTRFSYRYGLAFAPQIAGKLGVQYKHVRTANDIGARDVLRQSVCVLATGRAALEAMACGVPVVLCDERRPYMKPLMERDVVKAMWNNYSGRGGVTPNIKNVTRAVAEETAFGSRREHVELYHNSEAIVDALLEAA